jgi:hypothetical protein
MHCKEKFKWSSHNTSVLPNRGGHYSRFDEGYSRNMHALSVPDEGYSRNMHVLSVPDEGYSRNMHVLSVPDEGYSRNMHVH